VDQEFTRDEITLDEILRIFKKRIWWFIATIVLTGIATVVYLMLATPIYEATVTMKIEPQTKSTLTDIFSPGVFTTKPDISTEMEIIKSRSNLEKVVENLGLLDYFRSNGKNPNLDLYAVLKTLSQMITVSSVKDTSIVKISVQSSDPELAMKIANELARVYNETLQRLSRNEYTVRRLFIEEQIPKIEKELQDVEDALKKFKEQNKVFVLNVEAQNLLNLVYQFDSQINTYKIQMEETRAKVNVLTEQLSKTNQKVISSETIAINPVVSQLRAKLAELQIELTGLLQTYSENDSRVQSVRKKIEETEKMLKNEIERIVTAQVQTTNPEYVNLYNQLIDAHTRLQVFDFQHQCRGTPARRIPEESRTTSHRRTTAPST